MHNLKLFVMQIMGYLHIHTHTGDTINDCSMFELCEGSVWVEAEHAHVILDKSHEPNYNNAELQKHEQAFGFPEA